MPRMNDNPAMPASCAARATLTSGTAAPARMLRAFDCDFAKAAAQPDYHARHAAVAHDQIGAEPDDGHRRFRRAGLRENKQDRLRPPA